MEGAQRCRAELKTKQEEECKTLGCIWQVMVEMVEPLTSALSELIHIYGLPPSFQVQVRIYLIFIAWRFPPQNPNL